MKVSMQLAMGVVLLMAAMLSTPAQGMQNGECTRCTSDTQQQYASPVTVPLGSSQYTTQQRVINPPSKIYSLPFLDQQRVVNIEPSPAGGIRYATTTYYTDYVTLRPRTVESVLNGDTGVATCNHCGGSDGGGGGGLSGRVVSTNTIYRSEIQGSGNDVDDSQGCSPSPCGVNAHCHETLGGRAVCSCPPGHSGNPVSYCRRAECISHGECRGDMACRDGSCVNPCAGTCGSNANCEVHNHVPVCSCATGYKGDPFTHCRQVDPAELCYPTPCGHNTKCDVVNNVPTCSCMPGYVGSPLAGCRHECESDGECGNQESCKDFRCQSACSQCGDGAQCTRVQNHRAICECPKGYIGSPYSSCRPECYGDRDCPSGRPACFYGVCKNPCEGSCGTGADCNLRGLTPVCSCPRDMTGDPFVSCRPFTKEDLCSPNPCGTNAQCVPGYDNTNKERPVCTCFAGYTGNPLSHCVRGECQSDAECGDHRACVNYSCVNPCIGQCGAGAVCEAKRHIAVCKCPEGTQGDARSSCATLRSYAVARYH